MQNGKDREHPVKIKLYVAFLLLACLLFSSCGSRNGSKSGVKIRIDEQTAEDGALVQIPSFVSQDEEMKKGLRGLDAETKRLERIRERAMRRGERLEMRSTVLDVEGYPQVTVVWHINDGGTRRYELVTLCADEKNKLSITCREALEMTGMSGVDLSLKVGKLSRSPKIRGRLAGTQMQGFCINESGEVEEIYMKLTLGVERQDEETFEEHFYSYHVKEEALERLCDKGFDVP